MSEVIRPSQGERLLIDRLRRGESQVQAAKRLGYGKSRKIYQLMEADVRPCGIKVNIGSLKPHERARLMRRRVGKTQAEVAAELGVSRYWFNQMENGAVDCTTLLWYWES